MVPEQFQCQGKNDGQEDDPDEFCPALDDQARAQMRADQLAGNHNRGYVKTDGYSQQKYGQGSRVAGQVRRFRMRGRPAQFEAQQQDEGDGPK